MLAGGITTTLAAQTVRVRCYKGGVPTYKEVYEYDYVADKPTFPGGSTELVRYINNTRRYPRSAYSRGVQGRVVVSFVVNTDGTVSDVSVIRGVEKSLDMEAARIIAAMPKWTPGKIRGCSVPVRVIQTIPFRK